MKERNNQLDILRGIAICSVVLGHCWMRSDFLYWFIYRFHMVLFMTLSGYLFRAKGTFQEFFVKKAKALLVPYVLFSAFAMAVKILFLDGSVSELPKYLLGMLLGGKFCLFYKCFTLWYLPLMFIVSCIMYFVVKKSGKYYYVVLAGALLLTVPLNSALRHIFHNGYIPFSLQVIPGALSSMMVGYRLKEKEYTGAILKNKNFNLLLAVLLGTIGFFVSIGSWATMINPYRYLLIPAALLICHMIVVLTKNWNSRVLCFLGVNSLYIFGLHRSILYILQKRTGIEAFLIRHGIDGFFACVLIAAFVILLISVGILGVGAVKKGILKRREKEISVCS